MDLKREVDVDLGVEVDVEVDVEVEEFVVGRVTEVEVDVVLRRNCFSSLVPTKNTRLGSRYRCSTSVS